MFPNTTRVLVVDDMMTMRKVVIKVCKELGFSNIKDAADGELAWTILNETNPPIQLIISDWNMPNCTGLEFLKRVRADEKFKKTPFLLVTAEAEQDQIIEAVKSGVDQYVIKPFSAATLKTKLEIVFKKYSKA
ncbi:MAG: hypothetical protein COW01_00320 [Bdellovibrionales bacterium CG12_big_fil_rev_8_21_14_0_65_38_15]|nr:MAG: hypothetical protein COW79_09850 [Bdellovibrionales bacterium CG22_combo_CG10-13_8_21_14_all_38_13]PIQ57412.1 MAG: hypothetical protein COW01_00320 [Bdellovibrionales bacterium CG12_big_fil_rev_8_21_14_0_65_38_15]PIR31132.1 MAG: hypothetical protein COV38_01800 [Bdellovibrionales bacterium CG11_big_fil_rev_8_21_14_0_20_38_13]